VAPRGSVIPDDPRSVAFDRAAEYYDETRALSPEVMAANVRVLADELAGRGRVLEVGVGTGLLALPLSDRGIPLAGIDLSGPMLAQLARKAGEPLPFAVMVADATAMPFPDGTFGAAYLRWVLHLIPDWRAALAEMDRVVQRLGVLLVNLGGYAGRRREVQDRFSELTGISHSPVGLDWDDKDGLDEAMAALGRLARGLQPIPERGEESVGEILRGIEEDLYSWTWRVPEQIRLTASEQLRAWATDRWGDLDEVRPYEFATEWRAYDVAEP
jgi:SAM-dependent methyltransferase